MQHLSDEHTALYSRILEGSAQILPNGLEQHDGQEEFDKSAWDKCGALGLCGLTVPTMLGGSGLDPLSAVIAMEAFGRGCADNGLGVSLGAHLWGCLTLLLAGDRARNVDIIRDLATGRKIGALAVSEPEAGSDLAAILTTAVAVDGGYRLEGRKCYVTNAPVADVLVVLAETRPGNLAFGLSAFCLERGTPGLTTPAPVSKMGLRTASMGDVELDGCLVPKSARIGAEGAGLSLFLKVMEMERAFILAPAIGSMERVFEATRHYAQNRKQFDQPIAEFESVYGRLAEMYRRTSLARLVLRDAAARKGSGGSITLEASMAKLTISDAWVANCQDALAIFAAKGYLSATGIERELRDALGGQIYSGTSDIQRRTIAKMLRVIS
ncbi:acyl-CoA dehydrogenase family protein [Roseobacter sp. GAI101]|uniref:acyl-CoA dehydrogenase family protein n=1 Tax=Roseobacter sp. (strain GAI101) TaxID=391589 RepID=UPI0018DE725B|nr:acyl-CoA dehydrogenase family protein [Roseobacter sp. GAI101]